MRSIKHLACVCAILLVTSRALPQAKPETSTYSKQAVISESGATVKVDANNPRPLEQTLGALQQKYGWVVNYEDPQYVSQADLSEGEGPGGSKLPRGGRFSVEFPLGQEKEKSVQAVLDAYNRSENPGRFELRKISDALVVVGVEAHDAQGKLSPQKPVLDTPITLPTKQRSATDSLNLICRKIALQRGIPVNIGISPRNVMNHNNVGIGGTKVSARDLLIRTLAGTHRNLYWRLLFDPKSKGYFLNIHQVPKS